MVIVVARIILHQGKPAAMVPISRERSMLKLNRRGQYTHFVPTRSGGVDCANMHPFLILFM